MNEEKLFHLDINYIPQINKNTQPLYSTLGQLNNDDLLFESNIGIPYSVRNIYYLNENKTKKNLKLSV